MGRREFFVMATKVTNQLIQQIVEGTVRNFINGFLVERKSRGLSKWTLKYYSNELRYFSQYLDEVGLVTLEELNSDEIRHYLIGLSERRNQGGIHSAYRAIKAWLNWVWDEFEIEGRNPISRVSIPSGKNQPLPGISITEVKMLIDSCTTKMTVRDKALLMFLVDTGARRAEVVSLNIEDVDFIIGTVHIKHGKGDKFRIVYLGRKSRKALRKYVNSRKINLTPNSPLFTTGEGTRLTYSGLREIIRRRSVAAGIKEPGLHDFRRCFAVQMLRGGCDLVTLSRLLGHSSLMVTQRYLYLVDEDLQNGHQLAGPVDNAGW
jgi:site-specific recombinase XerD